MGGRIHQEWDAPETKGISEQELAILSGMQLNKKKTAKPGCGLNQESSASISSREKRQHIRAPS